ncbi:hypothetical protein OV450_8301 [Actinobacteria bacterium OV450]|nr:hypothetical protein OV450_8301 [Actinobacteria bacterium OV450]
MGTVLVAQDAGWNADDVDLTDPDFVEWPRGAAPGEWEPSLCLTAIDVTSQRRLSPHNRSCWR